MAGEANDAISTRTQVRIKVTSRLQQFQENDKCLHKFRLDIFKIVHQQDEKGLVVR